MIAQLLLFDVARPRALSSGLTPPEKALLQPKGHGGAHLWPSLPSLLYIFSKYESF